MRTEIKPNDIILHKPSGEKWVVAGVDVISGKLIPMGYPFPSIANIADCELIEERYEFESQGESVIKEFLRRGMSSFVDTDSAVLHGLFSEWEAKKMPGKALKWLQRELKEARITLGLAAYPSGSSDVWENNVKVLEYLCELVKGTMENKEDTQ